MAGFQALTIKAGPKALAELESDGLRAARIRALIGASGGPKWLGILQLDRAILRHLLTSDERLDRTKPIHMLGSSIGAWRYACYAQRDPLTAFQRFEDAYFAYENPARPTVPVMTAASLAILKQLLGREGAADIAANKDLQLSVSTARAKGWAASRRDAFRIAGITAAGLGNAVSRQWLARHFDRVIFYSGDATPYGALDDFATCAVRADTRTLRDILMATIAIPYLFAPVFDIAGAPPGMYCDGGIIDYHFDLPYWAGDGLALYPHFTGRIVPGWFDKPLKWRKPRRDYLDNLILIAPSPAMLARLPFGKIPDRGDFKRLGDTDRRVYWRRVLDETQAMADEFAVLCERGNWAAYASRI